LRVTVPSYAKLNLDLRVLDRRPDGYHNLRTVFQTVSLKDTLAIDFDFAKRTQIEIDSSVDIPDNLVVRSAKLVLDAMCVQAHVRFRLVKRIPMGAGLGGGSSNAAAVLLALPALARKQIDPACLFRLAESLGSDVPFFLRGGTVLALDRGTELYPLPDLPGYAALIVATGIHVSTREAYAALGRKATDRLTSPSDSPILREFQAVVWALSACSLGELPLTNDFEQAVFQMHPQLPALRRKLRRLGARPVRMTGSGSALFGFFQTREESRAAASKFSPGTAFPIRLLGRRQYRGAWRRALGEFASRQPLTSGE
jgi:4-diphosphocytidyl-2-C-methyl-D-erythritol kinase